MAARTGPVLVDTNVIIEAHRIGAWRALCGGYQVETVEDCVTETQTGFQRRRPEQLIDPTELQKPMAKVHIVAARELAVVDSMATGITLHAGERSLWAHALARPSEEEWVLCGPDKASLHFGVRVGFRERVVSLEQLLNDVGHSPKRPLNHQYTSKRLANWLSEIIVSGGR